VFVADDIAQIVLDWSIDGTGADRKDVGKQYRAPWRGWTRAVLHRQ
jgi:hypothetical protein